MQKNERTYRVVALVGLIIGVIALTVGFAAYTTTLTIKSSADVTPPSTTLDVVFSTSSNSVDTNNLSVQVTGPTGATADTATLNGTLVSGIGAHFTEPGQTVTYTFYVYNNSAYNAYLNQIDFKTVTGSDPALFKVCQPKAGPNPASANINEACNGITLTLRVHDISTTTGKSAADMAAYSPKKMLDTSGSKSTPITIEIAYANNAAIPEGDIEIAFGDIELLYKSTEPSA